MRLDGRTVIVLVTTTDTEGCLFTTTTDVQVVLLTQTKLCNGVNPVSIIIILLVLRECRVIVQLTDIRGSITLLGVEVALLQQHGIVITIEELITLRLVCTSHLQ